MEMVNKLILVIIVHVVCVSWNWVRCKETNVYIAVVEIEWDYAPNGDVLQAAGSSFNNTKRSKYKKAVYREYTSATFTEQKPRSQEHGIVGPLLKVNFLDKMVVHFKNLASRPYTVHVHGALYGLYEHMGEYPSKASEGAQYGKNWMAFPDEKEYGYDFDLDDAIPPGDTHRYKWNALYASGPYMDDDVCVPYVFHSQTNDLEKDIHSGPVGVILVCNEDKDNILDYSTKTSERYFSRAIDKDFVVILQTFDESKSWYAEENGVDADSKDDIFHAINGLTFGNLRLDACSGDLVRWWILALGSTVDVHSFTVHGHTLNHLGFRTSGALVTPGLGTSARMFAQEPGEWLIRDAFDQHYSEGLHAILNVRKCEKESFTNATPSGADKTYYIAAEETSWNYAPLGEDQLFLNSSYSNMYIKDGPNQLGGTYKKVMYVEYTDATFTVKKERQESAKYLGLLGPLIEANTGDNITVVFYNKASRPYSMHPIGLKYMKDMEGFRYGQKSWASQSVAPGDQFTYQWSVPALWLNQGDMIYQHESDCIAGLYHSAVHPIRDVQSGLVGPILLCNKEQQPLNRYVLFMAVLDENISWYIDENVKKLGQDMQMKDKKEFFESNKMHSINGYVYGNMPEIRTCLHEISEFHILTVGGAQNAPSVYLNGQSASHYASRSSGPAAAPAVYRTFRIQTSASGRWLLENMAGGETQKGMAAYVEVTPSCAHTPPLQTESKSLTRTYYIAAQEVEWDYAPMQYDFIREEVLWKDTSTGYKYVSFDGGRMGSRYKKVVYREYTDDTFQHQIPTTKDNIHLGILGPAITAGVGDTVKVVFRNKASRPYSIHAVGLQYNKSSEGYGYGPDPAPGSAVLPNETYTYTWYIPEQYGPRNDHYCVGRIYYSTVDRLKDLNSGLAGPIVICNSRQFDDSGKRDWPLFQRFRAFHLLFHVFDENLSWYFDENAQKYGSQNQSDPKDPEFKQSNRMYSINGRIYGNLEGIVTSRNTRVEINLLSVDSPDFPHAVNVHGGVMGVEYAGRKATTDTVPLLPGTTVLMTRSRQREPGTWLIKSAMVDQYSAGMAVLWHVEYPDDFFKDSMTPWWYWKIGRIEKNLLLVGGSIVLMILFLCVYYSYKKIRKRRGFDPHAQLV